MRALIVGWTLLCRIPRCCWEAPVPVNDDVVEAAVDVPRVDALLLLVVFLVAVTTVATGALVVDAAEFRAPIPAVEAAVPCLVNH